MPDTQPDTQPESQTARVASAVPEDPRARAARLRAEAAAIEASFPAGPGMVKVKVAPPHQFFSFGPASLGPEYSEIPAAALAGVMQSAVEAGVTLTIQEG